MAEDKESTSQPLSQTGEDSEDPTKSPPNSPSSSTRKLRDLVKSVLYEEMVMMFQRELRKFSHRNRYAIIGTYERKEFESRRYMETIKKLEKERDNCFRRHDNAATNLSCGKSSSSG
ncbi:hypothetical protein Sjap_018584 [Stephania japonica]|uniref:Uncharacterized protein n=1 Tax=Stephania japonica TaxID=461633 RepID=A0AAP0I881_9MAGN